MADKFKKHSRIIEIDGSIITYTGASPPNSTEIKKQPAQNTQSNYETYAESDLRVRKESPVFSGVLQYFPDAIMEISRHSKKGNDKHNPGQSLHWAKEKSKDHADCIARHLIDIGPNWDSIDEETMNYHATALAWRALALLQTLLDRQKD